MNRKHKLSIVAAIVAMATLFVVGTSYTASLASREDTTWTAGTNTPVMKDVHSAMWASLAEGLSLTTAGLDRALVQGKSPEALAKEQGIAPDKLAEKMQASLKAKVEEQVADGTLLRGQADALVAVAQRHMRPTHIASMVAEGATVHGKLSADYPMASGEGPNEPTEDSCQGGQSDAGTMNEGSSMMGQRF